MTSNQGEAKPSKFTGFLVVVVVFLSTIGGMPQANAEVVDEEMAEVIAEFEGITVDEAKRASAIGERVPQLERRLAAEAPNSFGGAYFDYAPVPLITVRWKAGQSVPAWLLDEPNVHVEFSEHNLAELLQQQAQAIETMEQGGVTVDAWADVRSGEVRVQAILEEADVARRLTDDLPAVEVEKTDQLAQGAAAVEAGQVGEPVCTSGFVVKHATFGKRATTAAHCVDSQPMRRLGPATVSLSGAWKGGSRDFAHFKVTSGHALSPTIFKGWATNQNGQRYEVRSTVAGTTGRSGTYVGKYVCKYGKVTGQTCGKISSESQSAGYLGTSTSQTFVRVERGVGAPALSAQGDSGGPWFDGNRALGWTSGTVTKNGSNVAAIYMSVDFLPPGWTVALS